MAQFRGIEHMSRITERGQGRRRGGLDRSSAQLTEEGGNVSGNA